MQELSELFKLLETNGSDLAWVLRSGLCGLQATLQEAKKKYTTDPGISDCEELLKKLDRLLELAPRQKQEIPDTVMSLEQDDSPFEPVPPQDILPVPSSQNELKLISLNDTLCSDTQVQSYLGDLQLQRTTDSQLWNEIQRLLLRVPATVANSWRQRLLELADLVGAKEDKRSLFSLPFSRDEFLYPGLTGEIKVKGLSLSKKLLKQQPPQISRNEDLFFLAGVVSTYLEFITLDSSLHHALKSVYRFHVTSLISQQERSKYIAALEDRFQRVLAAENHDDPTVTLRARLDLDEAIHSLVYLPPADRHSWWGKLQDESRRTLDRVVERVRNQGHKVQFRPLWGPYADVCALSKDDLELDSGGIQGEVLACLRVYANIDEEELRGRVLFRSLR
jgi:hypothetical protein